MYGYPCCNYNEGFGGGWFWIIIVVLIIFFILFWGNGNCNNRPRCC